MEWLSLIWSLATTLVPPAVGSALVALLVAGAAFLFGRRQGRRTAEERSVAAVAHRQEVGRQSVAAGRAAGDPAERLARNDRLWAVLLLGLVAGCAPHYTVLSDAGCVAYAEARLARPPARTLNEVGPPWADWVADLDDRMTGVCRRFR